MRRRHVGGWGAVVVFALGAIALGKFSPVALAQQPPLPAPPPAAATPPTELERLAKARDVAQSVADRLRAELTAALKVGVVEAIGACHTISPELVDQASATSGFEVTRKIGRAHV